MALLVIFSAIHQLFGDVFAVFSIAGSILMLFSPLGGVSGKIQTWGIGGFAFSLLGQIAMFITGTHVERIGIFFQFSPTYINSLLFLSLSLLLFRNWLQSNQYRFM